MGIILINQRVCLIWVPEKVILTDIPDTQGIHLKRILLTDTLELATHLVQEFLQVMAVLGILLIKVILLEVTPNTPSIHPNIQEGIQEAIRKVDRLE